jgi:hypothetical protein
MFPHKGLEPGDETLGGILKQNASRDCAGEYARIVDEELSGAVLSRREAHINARGLHERLYEQWT